MRTSKITNGLIAVLSDEDRSADVYANTLPQSTSWWLSCMCLVHITSSVMSMGDSFSFFCFNRNSVAMLSITVGQEVLSNLV